MRVLTRIGDWLAFPYSMFLLLKDPAVSTKVKLKAGAILVVLFFYLLDPLDVIPDIAPVLGWLDDLVAIPLAMAVTRKLIPEVSVSGLLRAARADTRRFTLWIAALLAAMTLISLTGVGLLVYFAVRNWPGR
jgi:uncharacterized membrane protein YkvA (DUF1232 family)